MPRPTARLVAFVGPSLDAASATAICPGVQLLPPVCQGDVSTVVEFVKPRAILILDGEFGQTLSVWHKEILAAINAGIRVLGASSMGALRAAELDVYGMEGVGEIYRHYRDGWLTDDADVALLHGDAETGYRTLTWPLVNVRATVAALAEARSFDAATAADVLAAAARIHFTERTAARLAAELRADGYDDALAARVVDQVAMGYVDQKALDARAAFARLAVIDSTPRPPAEQPRHRAGRGFEALLWSDVTIKRRRGTLRRYQLVNDVALHEPGFAELLERAADRFVLLEAAASFGVTVSPEECAEQRRRMLARLGLTEESLDDWLVANDLDDTGFAALVEREATVTRMRRWILDSRLYERARRMVIEQLQIEGRYARAADAAARRRRLTASSPPGGYPTTDDEVRLLVARHAARTGWQLHTDLLTLADEHGFDSLPSLLVALGDAEVAATASAQRRARVAEALGVESDAGAPRAAPPPRPDEPAWTHALIESHQPTQVVLAAVELGLPDALRVGGLTVDELAAKIGALPDRLARLLEALELLRIVERSGTGDVSSWNLAPAGAALNDGLGDYARDLRASSLPAWAHLAAAIRGAGPLGHVDDGLADRAVAAVASILGLPDLLPATLELPRGARVLDVGGGLGLTAQALREARPDVEVTVVELAPTAARAATRLAEAGSDVRVVVAGPGDWGEPPADRVLLERVLLNLDDSAALELLERARRALAPGGRIEVLDVDRSAGAPAVFIDLLSMARSGGRVRSQTEWTALAARAGLRVAAIDPIRPPFLHLTLDPTTETNR